MDSTDSAAKIARPHVFISHSSLDKEAIWPIVQMLSGYGALPWVDALEMRPGDQLYRRISTAIEETTYLLAMISPNSVKSNWVQEEVRQAISAEFYDKRVRVIPCIIGNATPPPYIRDRIFCNFSDDIVRGTIDVLRGIYRDHHVIELHLDQSNPLLIDEESARNKIDHILSVTHDIQRFFFILNTKTTLDQIESKWPPIDRNPFNPFADGTSRDRRALPLILSNLSCILSKAAAVTIDTYQRDVGLTDALMAILQRTTALTMYQFWRGFIQAAEPGALGELTTIDGAAVTNMISEIEAIVDHGRIPGRSPEAYVFNCDISDLLDLSFQGSNPVFDSRVDVPINALANDTKNLLKWLLPLDPDSEIFNHDWLQYFVPAIAARHIVKCSYSGQQLGHFLERIGLRKSDYTGFGYS